MIYNRTIQIHYNIQTDHTVSGERNPIKRIARFMDTDNAERQRILIFSGYTVVNLRGFKVFGMFEIGFRHTTPEISTDPKAVETRTEIMH